MSTLYRVIVATHVPFCEPTEFAFGPAQPDKFKALLSLGAALDLHDSGAFTTSVRIECTEDTAEQAHRQGRCKCEWPAKRSCATTHPQHVEETS